MREIGSMNLDECAITMALLILQADADELDDFLRERVDEWDAYDQPEKLLTICRMAISSVVEDDPA